MTTTSLYVSMQSWFLHSMMILMQKQKCLQKIKKDIINILIPRVKAKYPKIRTSVQRQNQISYQPNR